MSQLGRLIGTVAAVAVLAAMARADGMASGKTEFRGAPHATAVHVQYASPDDALYASQWHLHAVGTRPHANLEAAWTRATGSGVTIGLVDDSLEWTHPDLQPNYVAGDSWDFGEGNADPSPVHDEDDHGTSVAGVAAARGNNGIGISGAAPQAGLAGLRIDFINQSTAMFADATRYHSDGAGPQGSNIAVKNHSYGIRAGYITRSMELDALNASAANGTIHTFAAGNERPQHGASVWWDGDTNKKALLNSPDSIVVGALGSDGKFASYSNWGANLVVTAPSSGTGIGITTTDRTGGAGYAGGDYTSSFGGTSSSAPLVAGVMALGKQVNPNMDVRMAKHLLALTADSSIDAGDSTETSDGGWKTNAAGIRFNQNYGFGLIDAAAFVEAAEQYSGVTELSIEETGTIPVGRLLPDAVSDNLVPGTLIETFTMEEAGRLEEVLVTLNVSHTFRGDLQARLISPSGTEGRLMQRNLSDPGYGLNWTFTSNTFWGEEAAGEWSLVLEDWFRFDTGQWNAFAVTARKGELVPEPATFALLAIGMMMLSRRWRG